MSLTVTGVETIEITDPQGLSKPATPTPDPLEALKARPVERRGIGRPHTDETPLFPPPFTPFPGVPRTMPRPGPYTDNPVTNPIPLPGHTPAERPQIPWAQWTHLTGGDEKWTMGLRGVSEETGRHLLGVRKSATEQVF